MARRAWSVENNQPWCRMMQQEKMALKFWEKQDVLHYHCVDTGALQQQPRPCMWTAAAGQHLRLFCQLFELLLTAMSVLVLCLLASHVIA